MQSLTANLILSNVMILQVLSLFIKDHYNEDLKDDLILEIEFLQDGEIHLNSFQMQFDIDSGLQLT